MISVPSNTNSSNNNNNNNNHNNNNSNNNMRESFANTDFSKSSVSLSANNIESNDVLPSHSNEFKFSEEISNDNNLKSNGKFLSNKFMKCENFKFFQIF